MLRVQKAEEPVLYWRMRLEKRLLVIFTAPSAHCSLHWVPVASGSPAVESITLAEGTAR